MTLTQLFNDKSLKPKEKTEQLKTWLLESSLSVSELINFANSNKDSVKGTCIEALEFATKSDLKFADQKVFDFAVECLAEKAPRIKWESAKIIANVANKFSKKLDDAIPSLLKNTEHEGTVVRWSAALALGEIIKTSYKGKKDLIPVLEKICKKEEKNSIKKIYLAAFKKK